MSLGCTCRLLGTVAWWDEGGRGLLMVKNKYLGKIPQTVCVSGHLQEPKEWTSVEAATAAAFLER